MIKRIIFDLDNTLIMWKDEYVFGVEQAAKLSNVNIDIEKVDKIVDSFDTRHKKISKKALLKDINQLCNLNLNINFVNNLLNIQKNFAEKDEEVIETIKYLNSKYELVVLTNYFTEVQKARLEKAEILKYFKEVYGGDYCTKPNKKSYKIAIGNHKKEECLMIGDNVLYDVLGALEFGLPVIAFDPFNKISNDYKKITKIKDLKNIL